jgi:hypothetical protein
MVKSFWLTSGSLLLLLFYLNAHAENPRFVTSHFSGSDVCADCHDGFVDILGAASAANNTCVNLTEGGDDIEYQTFAAEATYALGYFARIKHSIIVYRQLRNINDYTIFFC